MRLLSSLTAEPFQKYRLTTEAGDKVDLTLRYLPTQQAWIMNIAWGTFTLNGRAINISPNMLFQFKNILPFGFAVISNTGIEPSFLDDFASGRVKIYVLNKSEIGDLL
jgi:hypothetical protein